MDSKIIDEDLENIFERRIPWNLLDNKTLLITGAYGMLASYMMFMLMFLNEKKGMHIQIIAIIKSVEKFEKRFGSREQYPYIKIYTSSLEQKLNIKEDVDFIIHAASLASPQYYGVCPIEVLKPNVIGQYYLLELAEQKNIEGYLLFSTGDIYGQVRDVQTIEERNYGTMDTLDIHNCYSESKRMAETMCQAWYYQKKVPTKIARIWHTYAPTMDIEGDPRVFASFVKDIMHNHDIVMKSDGSAKRSFCYIADAVAGYFLILLCGESGEAYNVCNTAEFYSVATLADKLVDICPEKGLRVIRQKRSAEEAYVENTEANDIPPDNRKLQTLGWECQYSVEAGFQRVIKYLNN